MPFELFFFFNDTATTEIYTLSLHDALPICDTVALMCLNAPGFVEALFGAWRLGAALMPVNHKLQAPELQYILDHAQCKRSEEHTSELQSHLNLVCRLLLEKKKKENTESV